MMPQKAQIVSALERLMDGNFIRLPLKGKTKTYTVTNTKVDPREAAVELEEEVFDGRTII